MDYEGVSGPGGQEAKGIAGIYGEGIRAGERRKGTGNGEIRQGTPRKGRERNSRCYGKAE